MKIYYWAWIVLLVLCSSSLPALAGNQSSRPGCHVCGMYIDQYQKTTGEITSKNGMVMKSCGVACLLRMVQDGGGPDGFTSIRARDFISGQQVDAKHATYVLSSDVIPDMLPSLIAFAQKIEAEKFHAEHGGQLINFTQALRVISPMAMTMPARILTAVVPAKGSSGIGLGLMSMKMDTVKIGSNSVEVEDFIQRPGQTMGPKEMSSQGTMLMASYGITDKLAINLNLPYLEKKMTKYAMGGTSSDKNSGIGDLNLSMRYNFFKDIFYNHFITVYGGTTLPLGDFDLEWLDMSGMQLGSGAFSFSTGLLYSYRYNNLWLHSMVGYTHRLENNDDYQFGYENKYGVALHHTPNYNLMYGLEAEGVYSSKNQYQDVDIDNSGGFRSKIAAIFQYRFITALGGNFSLRLSAGLPIYEDLNHTTAMGMEKVQLGGGWFGNVAISFKRRFAGN